MQCYQKEILFLQLAKEMRQLFPGVPCDRIAMDEALDDYGIADFDEFMQLDTTARHRVVWHACELSGVAHRWLLATRAA